MGVDLGGAGEAPEAAEAAELARQQADPDRLMDGEDPDTDDIEDALHWLHVYEELITFKRDLLRRLRSHVDGMATEHAQDEAQADERLLELELQRFQGRIDFWAERVSELEGEREAG